MTNYFNNYFRVVLAPLWVITLIFTFSACHNIGTAKFDEVATGSTDPNGGGNGGGGGTTPTTFQGISSASHKTDSTVTLNWSTHANAVHYKIYDVTSGSPVLIQTVSNPSATSLLLTGLTPDGTYKYRVRMEDSNNTEDTNTNDVTVTLNHAPEIPETPAFHTPASSPNTIIKPTFSVSGVKAGDTVKLFANNACTGAEVASGTVGANQTSISLQVDNNLSANTYFIYANSTNLSGHESNCTGSFLTYVLTTLFNGLVSANPKTDSTVTLNWTAHAKAINYLLYDVSSATPVYLQSITPPATSVTLTGLTPDATKKYRLRMNHSEGLVDDNVNDLTVVLDHKPAEPNAPTYKTPASSPGTNTKPTFTVSGVKAGDIVQLYQDDATCNSAAVASGTVGVGQSSIDLTLINALPNDDLYTFYADAINSATHHSNCSAGLDYELIQPTCPTNYIQMAANATLGTPDFCVSKYEAKCVNSGNGTQCSGTPSATNVATAQAAYTPWVNITALNAWAACDALNTESTVADRHNDVNNDGTYALISNREWMAVAREIETTATNWNNGVVGNTTINRGHSNGSSALAADVTGVDPDDGACVGTGQTCSDTTWHINRRTHNLANGVIWDIAGNVWEWTDWSIADSAFTSLSPTGCSGSGWVALLGNGCTGLSNTNDYLPTNSAYTSTHGMGQLYKGSGGAALRGGSWHNGPNAGVFALSLYASPGSSSGDVGFRCVYRP